MGMNMQSRNIVLAAVLISLLPACSMGSKKKLEYKNGATQVQPLEVPPDLTAPELSQRNVIPGTDGVQVASYSEYAKQATEQPCVNPASAPAPASVSPAAVPAAKLQESNGAKAIVLGEPFDRSWRRVGLALDRARVKVTDKDRSKGIYFVQPVPDKDKKKDKKSPDYLVSVSESSGASSVTVADLNGKSDSGSERLLDVLFQGLNQENNPGDEIRPAR